jgi:hypothetical protein
MCAKFAAVQNLAQKRMADWKMSKKWRSSQRRFLAKSGYKVVKLY